MNFYTVVISLFIRSTITRLFFRCSVLIMGLCLTVYTHGTAQTLTGVYKGTYKITMRAAPAGSILGFGVKEAEWIWDFDKQTVHIAGSTLSVGFNYALHDLDDADPNEDEILFDDHGDGTYTLYYNFQIYHPGLGLPQTNTTSKLSIIEKNDILTITTMDVEIDGEDGIPGTQIIDVFPLTVEPDLVGSAYKVGTDSNGDGILDSLAIELGLDPSLLDSDGDGLSDVEEIGKDFENPLDSDRDGQIDALEVGSFADNGSLVDNLRTTNNIRFQIIGPDTGLINQVAIGEMQVPVDNLSNVEDITRTDSTLGQPGMDYAYGNVSFTYSHEQVIPSDSEITFTLNFETDLPNPLLVYILNNQNEYEVLDSSRWYQSKSNELSLTMQEESRFDLGNQSETLSMTLALTENRIGAINTKDNHSGIGTANLFLLMILGLLIRPRKRGNPAPHELT